MIADSSHKVPVSPLRQGLIETAQKSIDLVRVRMEENVQQSLFVVRTEHQVCKYIDDQTLQSALRIPI
jgi:hypothetical protein